MKKKLFIIMAVTTFMLSCSKSSKDDPILRQKNAAISAINNYDFEIAAKNLDSLGKEGTKNNSLLDSLTNLINEKKEFYNSFKGKYVFGGGSFESSTGTYYYIVNLYPEKKIIKLELRAISGETEVAGDYKMEGDTLLRVKWDKSNFKNDIGNIKINGRLNTLQMIRFHTKPNTLITLKKED